MGPEASGDLSKDDGGPQRPFAAIIGVGHVAAGDEAEEVVPVTAHGIEELAGGAIFWRLGKQPVEPSVEIGAILLEGAVHEARATAADSDGAQQEALKGDCEAGIAVVDGVLGVAQEMGVMPTAA